MNWAMVSGKGIVTESSGGIRPSQRWRLSPDAAWISTPQRGRRTPGSEFVIELLSPTDRPNVTHKKMLEWTPAARNSAG